MLLPAIPKADLRGKKVLLRADLDVEVGAGEGEILRLKALVPTLNLLTQGHAKTVIIGHLGRPTPGDKSLTLKEVSAKLAEVSNHQIKFVSDLLGEEAKKAIEGLKEGEFLVLENLRFDPGEEENSDQFARKLGALGEIYVNEAFSSCHREHASITGVPKYLPHFAGERLRSEVENLNQVLENPQRPVVGIIGGVKKDKLDCLAGLTEKFDKVLVGGRLPEYLGIDKSVREYTDTDRQIVANLIYDKEDITLHSIEVFEGEIAKAKTIILAGTLGKYEDKGHSQGTEAVYTAVAQSNSFKVIGGGDSLRALEILKLTDKFDWVSVGGGAMLQFLAKGTLPGIEALLR